MQSSIVPALIRPVGWFVLVMTALSFSVVQSHAQSGSPSSGPPGGIVHGVACDGVDVVVATDRGVASLTHQSLPFSLGQRATGIAVMGRHVLASTDSATILRITGWRAPATPLTVDTGLRSLHIIGQDSRHIYAAATARSGDPVRVYRTADTGTSWSPFYSASTGWEIASISTNGDSAAVASQSGIWITDDNGINWRQISTRMLPFVLLTGNWITAAGAEGFGISTDFGDTWDYSSTGLLPGVTITSHSRGAGFFIVGTVEGIYRSVDTGRTWSPYNAGLTNRSVTALARKGDSILAGTAGGGVNYLVTEPWRPLPLWQTATVNAVEYAADGVLLAATDGGVYRQAEWLGEWYYTGLHDRIAALQVVDSVVLAGSGDSGVFRSLDLGITWTHSSTGLGDTATRIFSFLNANGNLLVATNAGLFRSRDTGNSWTAVAFPPGKIFRALRTADFEAIDNDFYFGAGGYFLNADYGILARSSDGGASWSVIDGDDAPIAALGQYQGRLWRGVAGIYANGLYYSLDQGSTWTQVTVESDEVGVLALRVVFHPEFGDGFFIGHTRGVSFTRAGAMWPLRVTSAPVTSIVGVGRSGGVDFTFGTIGSGAIQFHNAGMGVAESETKRLVLRPNPARDRLIIEADAELSGHACISLHDAMGRVVREIRTSDASTAGVTIDTHGLHDGIYLVRLATGRVQRTSTVVITH